jgi:hypothetical protein
MLDETDKKMIISFLKNNYPVTRVKHNNRFRRGMNLDGHIYVLSEKNTMNLVKQKLIMIVKLVFACDGNDAMNMVNIALNI